MATCDDLRFQRKFFRYTRRISGTANGVSAIRLTIRSGAGERQGFASCAEIEFYKKNPEHFNYSELFTDVTCSELKNGITEQEILKCNYAFFKKIAYYMFHGKYNKEFRVNTFKAYPHPDEQVKTHKTTAYSMMDNPTGIAVEAGEDMVVLGHRNTARNIGIYSYTKS